VRNSLLLEHEEISKSIFREALKKTWSLCETFGPQRMKEPIQTVIATASVRVAGRDPVLFTVASADRGYCFVASLLLRPRYARTGKLTVRKDD